MKERIKSIIIIVLFIIIAVLSIVLITNKTQNAPEEYQSRISALQEENSNLLKKNQDNEITTKKEVCNNFLTEYYTISHSKSKLANLPSCKKYMTDNLYTYLSPEEISNTEYSPGEIDMDYNSTIIIKKYYVDCDDSEKLIANCTINKTVNDMNSSNDYFIEIHLEKVQDNWLIDSFDIISS